MNLLEFLTELASADPIYRLANSGPYHCVKCDASSADSTTVSHQDWCHWLTAKRLLTELKKEENTNTVPIDPRQGALFCQEK